MGPDALTDDAAQSEARRQSLVQLQKARQVTVIVALVLLVASMALHLPQLAYLRSACWALAGCLSVAEGLKGASHAGGRSPYLSAGIYFLVALLPILRQM